MRLAKIKNIEKKALKESQKAVDKIMAKYSKQIHKAIKEQLPKGYSLESYNGLCFLVNEKGVRVKDGCYWSRYHNGNPQLEYLAGLQYSTQIDAGFYIEMDIKN